MDTAAIITTIVAAAVPTAGAIIAAVKLWSVARERRIERERVAREKREAEQARARAAEAQADVDEKEVTGEFAKAVLDDSHAVIEQLRRQVASLFDWNERQQTTIAQLQDGYGELQQRLAVAASDLLGCRAREQHNQALIDQYRRENQALIAQLRKEREEHATRNAQLEQHIEGLHRALRDHGVSPISDHYPTDPPKEPRDAG